MPPSATQAERPWVLRGVLSPFPRQVPGRSLAAAAQIQGPRQAAGTPIQGTGLDGACGPVVPSLGTGGVGWSLVQRVAFL